MRRFSLAMDMPGPASVAVDDTSVYWATSAALKKVPVSGGTPTVLANLGQGLPVGLPDFEPWAGIALDATSVYWIANDSDPGEGKILEIAK